MFLKGPSSSPWSPVVGHCYKQKGTGDRDPVEREERGERKNAFGLSRGENEEGDGWTLWTLYEEFCIFFFPLS